MMNGVMLALLLLAVAADAHVKTTDGKVIKGPLTGISAEGVALELGTGSVTDVPLRNVLSIQIPAAGVTPVTQGPVSLELADGSQLVGSDFTTEGSLGRLTLLDGETTRIPRRALKAIRLDSRNSPPADAWKQVLATNAATDLLVVRKFSKDGLEVRLDPLEGTVLEITAESVKFDYDGDKIDVKREKLEGIVFFKPAKPTGKLICRAMVPGKGAIQAARLEIRDGNLLIESLGGAQLVTPLTSPLLLDFRSANEVRLSDLEPDSSQSAFSLQPKGMKHDFGRIFGPRGSGPFGGSGLVLGKQTFDSGLTLHSPTTVIYRVPEGCRKFLVTAGVSEDAARSADMRLKVLADQKVVIDQVFNSDSGRGPLELECDVTGVKRLSLAVEAGAGLDFGDVLILGDARFVK